MSLPSRDQFLRSLRSINPSSLPEGQRTCGICNDDYKADDQPVTLSCGHTFGECCLRRWFDGLNNSGLYNNTCPFKCVLYERTDAGVPPTIFIYDPMDEDVPTTRRRPSVSSYSGRRRSYGDEDEDDFVHRRLPARSSNVRPTYGRGNDNTGYSRATPQRHYNTRTVVPYNTRTVSPDNHASRRQNMSHEDSLAERRRRERILADIVDQEGEISAEIRLARSRREYHQAALDRRQAHLSDRPSYSRPSPDISPYARPAPRSSEASARSNGPARVRTLRDLDGDDEDHGHDHGHGDSSSVGKSPFARPGRSLYDTIDYNRRDSTPRNTGRSYGRNDDDRYSPRHTSFAGPTHGNESPFSRRTSVSRRS